jgi:hypothetical protein
LNLSNPLQLRSKVVGVFLELLERLGHFVKFVTLHARSVALEAGDLCSDLSKARVQSKALVRASSLGRQHQRSLWNVDIVPRLIIRDQTLAVGAREAMILHPFARGAFVTTCLACKWDRARRPIPMLELEFFPNVGQ